MVHGHCLNFVVFSCCSLCHHLVVGGLDVFFLHRWGATGGGNADFLRGCSDRMRFFCFFVGRGRILRLEAEDVAVLLMVLGGDAVALGEACSLEKVRLVGWDPFSF